MYNERAVRYRVAQHFLVSALFLALVACTSAAPSATPSPTKPPQPTHTPAASATMAPTKAPSFTASPVVAPTDTSITPDEKAANADVLHVRAVAFQDGTWTFHVTVEHPDSGWEDYADGWDVLTPDGEVLKPDPSGQFTRLLLHPHENEQPFTRSQAGIVIPDGITQVNVRAHDLVDGYGGREVVVDLTVSSGPDFEVERGN